MATYTENYNLEKPAQSDLYNINVFNENADKIDEALGSKAANQSLAPIESSATASRNYSVGQQFVYNGLLYEATSAIASGGTITPGSNCARTTVAEELSALNDSITNYCKLITYNVGSVTVNSFDQKNISIPSGTIPDGYTMVNVMGNSGMSSSGKNLVIGTVSTTSFRLVNASNVNITTSPIVKLLCIRL